MIPSINKFISFQDKRIIPLFYVIVFIVLGFYWKNTNYHLTQRDVLPVTGLITALLFNFTYELKAYWAYSYTMGRVDFSNLKHGHQRSGKNFFLRISLVFLLAVFGIGCIVKASLIFVATRYSIIFIYSIIPLYLYLIFRYLRANYIAMLVTQFPASEKYINLYQYVSGYLFVTTIINLLSISPLASHSDFSLSEGFNSIRLMIAMLILCVIVLALNLLFINGAKRYIFLGKIFLKEINLYFTQSLPFKSFHLKSKMVRAMLLIIALSIWIVFVSLVSSLLQWNGNFEVYFLFCYLPCSFYYFLQLYWHCHNEFMMSCDMYLRYQEIEKRKN